MRYLHVLESFRADGAERTFLHTLQAFRDAAALGDPLRGRETHDVLAFATGPLHRDFALVANRVIVSALASELAAVLTHDYDVIHVLAERCAHRVAPIALAVSDAALVYSKPYDAPAMYRLQGHFDCAADESVLSACDAVTFTTLNLAAGYRLPPGRATILRKAAPLAAAFDLPPLGRTDLPPRLLCAADLQPRKRLDDLVPMLARVLARVPATQLRVVGRGTPAQVSALTDRIADAGLSRVMHVVVPSSDAGQEVAGALARELAQARCFVLPSGAEGVSSAVLAAMAAARPVVATRVGHIGHILTHGHEGFLVSPGDIEGLAAHVATLLEQPELAARMGTAGRQRAAAHDVSSVAQDLLTVLRRAATVRRKAA